ncbi:hypothetical protein [Nitrospirillum pindoramense]|uniref:GcrA cell cycle regulator n=1 Tax=Nitrospirillum amazonense TaxID=28077 RepID=A0A560H000_9PROT|nr:hypothetical protein [Nitrospirillum amazonense]TWB39602.1 hypothetical protein FBZ90_11066 [Nitrospirillum amazonense]
MRSAVKVGAARSWDEESLARLIAMNAAGQDDREIAQALGRTVASVQHKRHLLRLATPVDHRRGRRMRLDDATAAAL